MSPCDRTQWSHVVLQVDFVPVQAAEAALAAAADVESQLTGRAKPEDQGGEELRRQRTAEILEQVGSERRPGDAPATPVLGQHQPCAMVVG